jgi:hypothetical protein
VNDTSRASRWLPDEGPSFGVDSPPQGALRPPGLARRRGRRSSWKMWTSGLRPVAAAGIRTSNGLKGSDTALPSGLARPGLAEHNGSMSDHLGIWADLEPPMPIRSTPKPRVQPHNGAEFAYTGANMSPLRPANVGRAPLAGWKCPDVKSLGVNRIGIEPPNESMPHVWDPRRAALSIPACRAVLDFPTVM